MKSITEFLSLKVVRVQAKRIFRNAVDGKFEHSKWTILERPKSCKDSIMSVK
jgi:hypothetical protein